MNHLAAPGGYLGRGPPRSEKHTQWLGLGSRHLAVFLVVAIAPITSLDTLAAMPPAVAPIMLGTWSFSASGCRAAIGGLLAGGNSVDSVCTAARCAELDARVDSVGYGGLPDATGAVTLDACVMLSPEKCGGVCAVSRHLAVTDVARLVMERTRHVLLAGPGADSFADAMGVTKARLLSPQAAQAWETWKRGEAHSTTLGHARDSGCTGDGLGPVTGERHVPHDTIGLLAIDAEGVMAGACSTSGLPYKLAGRVGDSPIPGHGLYVEPGVGAAVATGVGEMVMGVCGSFLAVECMRRGASPIDAVREVLERIDRRFQPEAHQQVALIAMTPTGEWSAGALFDGFVLSIADAVSVRVAAPQLVMHPDVETSESAQGSKAK